ncbi:hypothetical protein ACHAXT_001885, partial [Thalassiosira profunda]
PGWYDSNSVYESVEECCEDAHAACPTGPPTVGPTLAPSWAPTQEKECYTLGGDCTCVVVGGVPGYIGDDYRGFASYGECCASERSGCPSPAPPADATGEPTEPPTPSPSKEPTKLPTDQPSPSPTTSVPTTSPSPAPTPEATGPNGQVYRAYPDLLNGIDDCLFGDDWPAFMGVGNNPEDYLFLSLGDCCVAKGYSEGACAGGSAVNQEAPPAPVGETPAPSRGPTSEPTDPPSKEPTPSPSMEPTDQPTKEPTKPPTPAPSVSPSASPTTRAPTVSPTLSPTPEATGPNGQVYRAYPNVLDGIDECLFGDEWPAFMGVGNNPDDYLFASLAECCAAREYDCTQGGTPAPSPWAGGEFWYSDIHADGNLCVFGDGYPAWMGLPEYRESELFDSKDACCIEHACDEDAVPSNGDVDASVVTFVDEDFEGGDTGGLPWLHGGTPTHYADWNSNSHTAASGTKSLRSGDLNNRRDKSSDLSLTVDSSSGGRVTFNYKASVAWPFESFQVRLDGSLMHMDASPMTEWDDESFGVPPGVHTISFHVVSYADEVDFGRDVDPEQFGDGFAWIDDLEFFPTR